MNKKGFILLDALLAVFIVALLVVVTTNVYGSYKTYKDGYDEYQEEIKERYNEIYDELGECEKCVIEEDTKDSSLYEPS